MACVCAHLYSVWMQPVCVKGLHVGAPLTTFDVRKVELTPLEQRKLTFDSHAMVTELQSSGEVTVRRVGV